MSGHAHCMLSKSSHEHKDPVYSSLSFSTSGVFTQVSVIEDTNPHLPYDLVTLLLVAEHFQVDFLPITWQSALDRVRLGGTAKIRQSLVRLQESLAFKLTYQGIRTS